MNVSIIIPVYNGQKYVKKTILSALNQEGCEVIVVNDGSTDNTQKILDWFGARIKVINHDKNYGTAKALNSGIHAASCDWIKWLSADDILKADAVHDMLDAVSGVMSNDDKIFYTDYDIIDETDYILKHFHEPDNSNNQKAVLLDHFYGNGSTSLIHKNVFKKCGMFDETLGYQEDYEFWLRCVLIHGIDLYKLELNTVFYRVHDGQLTALHKGESLKKADEIREKILSRVPHYRQLVGSLSLPYRLRLKRMLQRLLYT